MNTSLWFTGGNIAERLMRDRGRTRAGVAAWNHMRLKKRLGLFLSSQWRPARGRPSSHYAICLTSWSKRLGDMELTLLTLIDQDVRPSDIYVWLTPDDRELLAPERRALFEAHGVRFEACPDYRSHKKWLPLVLSGRKDPFVICDDDIFYPREWFGRLVAEDCEDAYVGCKCHRIRMGSDLRPEPYSTWEKQIQRHGKSNELEFATGCGGVIIHPKRLNSRSLDWNEIHKHAKFSDDAWLNFTHRAAGFPAYKTRYSFPCIELPGTNDSGLLANHNTSRNDQQISAVWDFFNVSSLFNSGS